MNEIFYQIDASEQSTIRCGGTLYRVVMPQDYQEIIKFCQKYYGEEKIIIGGLSNTLVLSGGEQKLCIATKKLKGVNIDGDILQAKSGERLAKLAQIAQFYSLSGLENVCHIPGTIGGAVFGNSGSFGTEIFDIVHSIEVVDLDSGHKETLFREEIAAFYRRTNLKKNRDFIYSVQLRLSMDSCNKIALRMNEVKKKRQALQPNLPSLGSAFKRCDDGVSAGYYIEQAGLKGYGSGMTFSNKHANFIINNGGCAEDYLQMIEHAEKSVFSKLGKKLLREVNIIGQPKD